MFKKISAKQALAYMWHRLPQYKDTQICILNGAINTGKTDFGSKGWLEWAIETAHATEDRRKGWNKFLIVSTTKQSAFENVVDELLIFLRQKGYKEVDKKYKLKKKYCFHHNEQFGLLVIRHKGTLVRIRYIGANNKTAVQRIQGSRLRGSFIDEAGLILINTIENVIGRSDNWDDSRIVMTTNPEGNESHPFYETYVKGAALRGMLVLSFHYLDNPVNTVEKLEKFKLIYTPTMFLRKILGKWVRATGSIYKLFSRERHANYDLSKVSWSEYRKLYIGIDYGERAATVFTLIGMRKLNKGMDVLDTFYHKNSETDEKEINAYAVEFFKWVNEIHKRFPQVINVKVESASHGGSFFKHIRNVAKSRGISWLKISLVNKYKKDPTSKGAILERIDTLNIMIGAGYIRIDKRNKKLITAIMNCVWEKDDIRLDDETVDIDSLDSLEYAFLDEILSIKKVIEE